MTAETLLPPQLEAPEQFVRRPGTSVVTHNQRQLLDQVRRAEKLTRSDLMRACGLSAAGAKGLIDELVERGALRLGDTIIKGRGQPSATVELAPGFAYSLGIAVAVDNVRVMVVDFKGMPIDEMELGLFPLELDAAIDFVCTAIDQLLARHGIASSRVLGAGLSMTGPFYGVKRRVNPPDSMPAPWATSDLESLFAQAIGFPVVMENDSNCAAVAEALHGWGRSTERFAYLHFSDGFACGLIEGGRLLSGAHGNAGEIGRLYAKLGLRRPSLEFLRQDLAATGIHFKSIDAMLAGYDDGWPALDTWLDQVMPGLNLTIAALTALLDPSYIIFGARLPRALATRMINRIAFEDRPRRGLHAPNPVLSVTHLGHHAPSLGAALLPLKWHFFS